MRVFPRPSYREEEAERDAIADIEQYEREVAQKEKAILESATWIRMSDLIPPLGVTFVLTSSKWSDRQYVVKKVWSARDAKCHSKKSLSCLYWHPLPPFDLEQESCTSTANT